MDREAILREVQRLAEENGGVPPGRERFLAETGLGEKQVVGKFWVRWSDVLRDAGFQPNQWNQKIPQDELITQLVKLIRDLRHFPTGAEMRMRRANDPTFPSEGAFRRFGSKKDLAKLVLTECDAPEFDDVRSVCVEVLSSMPQREADDAEATGNADALSGGVVYLMKSGSHYKIGRSNSFGRRAYELAIQLPEKLELVHVIETDDAPGIERYWHSRFATKRANGEWFTLTKADVAAFRRRKKFM